MAALGTSLAVGACAQPGAADDSGVISSEARAGGQGGQGGKKTTTPPPSGAQVACGTDGELLCVALAAPDRIEVQDRQGGWLATFTQGARTVRLRGPRRTFSEPTAHDPVDTVDWVRLLPAPFSGKVDSAWLQKAQGDTSADILAVAMQYVAGAPVKTDQSGLQIAGDADYGPLQPDGTRQEGSDFNDYLGQAWRYPDGTVDQPEPAQLHALDCSGFMRMVWGYRSGMPLAPGAIDDASALPRRAVQILDSAPGIVVLPNAGSQPQELSALQTGDLVFFDAATNDGTLVDHIGMYLGRDTAGHARFLSSRKTVNGPTLGDEGGSSLLDGTGLYARAFRAARRL